MGTYLKVDLDQTIALNATATAREGLRPNRRAGTERPAAWVVVDIGERFVSLLLLAALLPFLIAAGIVVLVLSRRCPLVTHERVCRNGKVIRLLKLRTMWTGRPSNPVPFPYFVEHLKPEPVIKKSDDPRVANRFAGFCRRYSIDELPQLWHVVQGDLALVGPRPLTADELLEHYGADAGEVLRVKPGLTGLWQVRGRSCLSYSQRRRLDLFLVRRWSVRLYARILLDTIPGVLTGRNAW